MNSSTKCRKQPISRSDLNVLEFKTSELKAISRQTEKGNRVATVRFSEASACNSVVAGDSSSIAGDGDLDVLDPRRLRRSSKSSPAGHMHNRFDLMHLSHRDDLSVSSHFFLLLRPGIRESSATCGFQKLYPTHKSSIQSLCGGLRWTSLDLAFGQIPSGAVCVLETHKRRSAAVFTMVCRAEGSKPALSSKYTKKSSWDQPIESNDSYQLGLCLGDQRRSVVGHPAIRISGQDPKSAEPDHGI